MSDYESSENKLWRDSWLQEAEGVWAKRKSPVETWQAAVFELESQAALPLELGIIALMHSLIAFKSGQYQKALGILEGAQDLVLTDDLLLWQARTWMLRGIIEGESGVLDQGLSAWRSGLVAAKAIDDRESMLLCSYNIAVGLRMDASETEEALAYFTEALTLAIEREPHHVITANIYSGLCKCSLVLGHLDEATLYAHACMKEANEFGDGNAKGWAIENYCELYLKLGQLDLALDYALKNYDYWKTMDYAYGRAVACMDLSLVYGALCQHERAIASGQEALSILKTIESKMLIDKLYEQLMNSHEVLGNFREALEASRNLIKARADQSKHEVQREVARASAILQVEMAKRDAEIHRLRHVELSEKNLQLEGLTQELTQTLDHLRAVQTELIRQEKLAGLVNLVGGVAHEINTPLGNSITLTSFLDHHHSELLEAVAAKTVTPSLLMAYLEDLGSILPSLKVNLDKTANIINSFKLIAVNPNPLHIKAFSIGALLKEWKESIIVNFPHFAGIVDCQCIDDKSISIDSRVFFSLMDELLRNTIVHGYDKMGTEAVRVRIRLAQDPLKREVCFVYEDFGSGIAPDYLDRIFEPFYTDRKPSSGLGLGLHMVYNLAVLLLGGSVAIESKGGGGTRVRLCFKHFIPTDLPFDTDERN